MTQPASLTAGKTQQRPARERGACPERLGCSLMLTLSPMADLCLIEDCGYEAKSRGWCRTHYGRWRRHGDPRYLVKPSPRLAGKSVLEILAHYLDAEGDCWLWRGPVTSHGYGWLNLGGRGHIAHRWVWEHLVGPIPDGLQIDHLCRVRHCVKPDHLEPVTTAENVRRGFGTSGKHGRQTKCLRGHPLTEDNVYVRPRGGRECRICKRLRKRRDRERARVSG